MRDYSDHYRPEDMARLFEWETGPAPLDITRVILTFDPTTATLSGVEGELLDASGDYVDMLGQWHGNYHDMLIALMDAGFRYVRPCKPDSYYAGFPLFERPAPVRSN